MDVSQRRLPAYKNVSITDWSCLCRGVGYDTRPTEELEEDETVFKALVCSNRRLRCATRHSYRTSFSLNLNDSGGSLSKDWQS
jgi:hypothetical protein